MSLPKLGEVETMPDGTQFIVTSRYPHGSLMGLGFVVWTPIPPGMGPEDLGRKFKGAAVQHDSMQANEHLFEAPQAKP